MSALPDEAMAIVRGEHADPFRFLGPHEEGGRRVIRTYLPTADAVSAVMPDGRTHQLARIHEAGLFAAAVEGNGAYRLRQRRGTQEEELEDAYRFPPVLSEFDLHLLAEGTHLHAYEKLGAHPMTLEGVSGTCFAVLAPNARRVSVVGDFNDWDGRRHAMRMRGGGVWEIFVPGAGIGDRYKYEILGAHGELLPLKADPFAFAAEVRPATASIVCRAERPTVEIRSSRPDLNSVHAPISIYEMHLGSWRRKAEEGNRWLTYRELAETLPAYAADLGFTHVEFLPVMEHPFDGSWGYQPTGLFAPTSRFGAPDDFVALVEACHAAGLGVILDWVPGHFPDDPHGLGWFDGTALYEHANPMQGRHLDWNTLVYNFGRSEVANFLLTSALFWIERYGADGLRVDAVASMLYLDYSRPPGGWVPNRHGGRENLEAIDFLHRFNKEIYARAPTATTMAEESTAWPMVSRPVDWGGLGFGYKWNMGWMNDTLRYIGRDPLYRKHHHGDIVFGLHYAFFENFVLPLSHDEVVHGKRSILGRMPGDSWQRYANLRAYYAFMFGHPGKKLMFMGCEFGQEKEWNHDASLDWHLLEQPPHGGVQALIRDLNRIYRTLPALHELDCDAEGFRWLVADDAERSVFAWLRQGREADAQCIVIVNFTPEIRTGYRVPVPRAGRWREVLNSDAAIYGGSNVGNGGVLTALEEQGRATLELVVPPLGALFLIPE